MTETFGTILILLIGLSVPAFVIWVAMDYTLNQTPPPLVFQPVRHRHRVHPKVAH